jgi:uncharacterized protein (TIGR02246 family)
MKSSLEVEVQALMARMAAAYRAGDAAGCAALFTADAALFSPCAATTHGRDAIEALHRDWTTPANSTCHRSAVIESEG